MSARKGERKLRVHCAQHRILFEVLEARTLVCDADGHALAHNFPFAEWWEFCCYCQTFWPSDAEHCGKGREHCPACEQPVGARYLCHRCMVLSNGPKSPPKGRGFRVSAVGRVEPSCPGCYGVAPPIIDHQCVGARSPFTTARPYCPFCDEIIWEVGVLGERQDEWNFDEAPAAPFVATPAPEPDGFEPYVEPAAAAPRPADDVLELWPQLKDTDVAMEAGDASRDALQELEPSEPGSLESGLPQDDPPAAGEEEEIEEEVPVAPGPLESDREVGVPERPAVNADAEAVTENAPAETVTITGGAPGGESLNRETPLSNYAGGRRRWVPRRALLLAGVVIAALIIVALLRPRPPADADTHEGVADVTKGGRADVPLKGVPTPKMPPEGMVLIPRGTFKMGRDGGDDYERPAHEVTVGPFYIDKFEVTCEEYQRFVDAKKYPAPAGWRNGKYPEGSARLPVEVSWRDANAYAKWAGKRLPTEKEWEFAARGADGRLYPWGNEWKAEAVNAKETGPGRLTEVGLRPAGASPFGAFDMAGNAWEWTADSIRSYEGGKIAEDSWAASKREAQKVIRGGGYLSNSQQATSTYRSGWPEHGADYAGTGFRCAKDVEPSAVRK